MQQNYSVACFVFVIVMLLLLYCCIFRCRCRWSRHRRWHRRRHCCWWWWWWWCCCYCYDDDDVDVAVVVVAVVFIFVVVDVFVVVVFVVVTIFVFVVIISIVSVVVFFIWTCWSRKSVGKWPVLIVPFESVLPISRVDSSQQMCRRHGCQWHPMSLLIDHHQCRTDPHPHGRFIDPSLRTFVLSHDFSFQPPTAYWIMVSH